MRPWQGEALRLTVGALAYFVVAGTCWVILTFGAVAWVVFMVRLFQWMMRATE